MTITEIIRDLISLVEDIEQTDIPNFPVSIEKFKQESRQRGYKPKVQNDMQGRLVSILSSNKIKCEIKLTQGGWVYAVGFGLLKIKTKDNPNYGEELLATLQEKLEEEGYILLKVGSYITIKGIGSDQNLIMSKFWDLVKTIENIEEINKSAQLRKSSGKLIQPSDIKFFHAMYNDFVNAIRTGADYIPSRGGTAYDARDHLMVLGITPEAREELYQGIRPYREHVVPGDLISRKVLEMIRQGRQEASKLSGEERKVFEKQLKKSIIRTFMYNLLIVYTTTEQANYLDSADGMNMRTTMPDGWSFDQNKPLARLRAAGYKVEDLTDEDRVALSKVGLMSSEKSVKNKQRRDKPIPYKSNNPERVNIDDLEEGFI